MIKSKNQKRNSKDHRNTERPVEKQVSSYKKKSGNKFILIITVLFMMGGLGLMLYPTFSDWWNTIHQSHAIAGYEQKISETENLAEYWQATYTYNRELPNSSGRFSPNEAVHKWYEQTLNINHDGIMGYIVIPERNIKLPIYHGTSEGILQVAAGHIEGSSLPVGGGSTHSVISGHSGLPSAKLFTNITDMEEGEQFYIKVLDEELWYQVVRMDTVLPDDTALLAIEEDKDYVTLVTCVPYGVNSHRLLVRGERIEKPETGGENE